MAGAKLTIKQKLFVSEYLVDLNATQAAKRAGYSEKTASKIASENLTKPEIQKAIEKAKEKLCQRTERSVDDAMADILRVGRAAEEAGNFPAAVKAYELDAKHRGAFTEKVQVSGDAGAPLVIRWESDDDSK